MKTAIIGAGGIAYAHARALRELGVEICGVFDVDSASAQQLAQFCDCPVIDDIGQIVQCVDMIHLCTPPVFRIEYAELAMRAGCHVVSEKPLAVSLQDGETLVKMAEQYGVRLFVDFNHRFRDGFQRLLRLVRCGAVGDVVSGFVYRFGLLGGSSGSKASGWRITPGSVCGMSIESLSHDIDMLMQLTGRFTRVKADVRSSWPSLPQFDNQANISFCTAGQATGLIHASWSSQIKLGVRGVIGTRGAALLEGGDMLDFDRLRLKTETMPYEQIVPLRDTYDIRTCPSYLLANRHFVNCIEHGLPSELDGAYGLEVLKISHAILKAGDSHQAIPIPHTP